MRINHPQICSLCNPTPQSLVVLERIGGSRVDVPITQSHSPSFFPSFLPFLSFPLAKTSPSLFFTLKEKKRKPKPLNLSISGKIRKFWISTKQSKIQNKYFKGVVWLVHQSNRTESRNYVDQYTHLLMQSLGLGLAGKCRGTIRCPSMCLQRLQHVSAKNNEDTPYWENQFLLIKL